MIEVITGLDTLTARCNGRQAARHPRTLAPRQTVTGPVHVHRRSPAPRPYKAAGAAGGTGSDDGLARDLADYDARFGVDFRPPRPPHRGVSLMPIPKDALKQLEYYAAALKAPRICDRAARLTDQGRPVPPRESRAVPTPSARTKPDMKLKTGSSTNGRPRLPRLTR